MNKEIDTILFDLDGTLLPMNEEQFVKLYLASITDAFRDTYDPKQLASVLFEGMGIMISNQSDRTNEALMWDLMEARFPGIREEEERFRTYYSTRFDEASAACPRRAGTGTFLHELAKKYRLILATNPVFPREAVLERLKWAGVDPADFSYITTYENSRRCKPDPAYYEEIIRSCNLDPKTCLMAGNDALEDMAAASTGMQTYLITDCLINRKDLDLSQFEKGSFEDFRKQFS